MKRKSKWNIGLLLIPITTFGTTIHANPPCERLRHELEHHCGAGLEFYGTHQNRDLVIMNTPYPTESETTSPRMICTYNAIPGFISIHGVGDHCEEAANITGNLCFRQGFSNFLEIGIDSLTNDRICSEAVTYSPLDPHLGNGYLWGSGFMRTKYVLVINNLEGFVERRPNPEYLGDDQPETRVIKLAFNEPNFESLREILDSIRIETMTRFQCDMYKSMLSKPLQSLSTIMIDGMTPYVDFTDREGATVTTGPCVQVRGFFPKFNQAVEFISRF